MQKEIVKVDNLIKKINHALDMGKNRLQWYTITRDEKHMAECREWNSIADMCINKLILEIK